MKLFSSISLIVGTLLLTISGCKNDPGSLGVGLIPQQDHLNVDTLTVYSTSEHSYLIRHNLGLGLTLEVGRAGPFEADALIRFSNVPDTMSGATVNSVDLTLFPNFIAGDTTGSFSFDVHELNGNWTEAAVLWDSLSVLSYAGSQIGSFQGIAVDSDTVVVHLAPEIASSWFDAAANANPIYGLLLKANTSPGAGRVIRGFESFQSSRLPELRIIATKNSVIDTFYLVTGSDAFVVNGSPLVDPAKSIYIQPSLAYEAMMKFDVSALPKNSVIHEAVVELTRDTSYQFVSVPSMDSVIATFLIDSIAHTDLSTSSPSISSRSGDVYSMFITTMVQRWANGFPNQGIQIKSLDDNSGSSSRGTLNPFVFYTSAAGQTLRPRLKIIYSTIR